MSTQSKDWLAKWLPLAIAILTNLSLVAFVFGKQEQRFIPIEAHVASDTTEKAIAMFLPRTEFMQKMESRDKEFSLIHEQLKIINAKLDRMAERSTTRRD